MKTNKHIYLDHSATTPVDAEVIAAMSSAMSNGWGNPSSTHADGRLLLGAAAHIKVEGEWNDDLMLQLGEAGPIR